MTAIAHAGTASAAPAQQSHERPRTIPSTNGNVATNATMVTVAVWLPHVIFAR
jgi:hypothetical protein